MQDKLLCSILRFKKAPFRVRRVPLNTFLVLNSSNSFHNFLTSTDIYVYVTAVSIVDLSSDLFIMNILST